MNTWGETNFNHNATGFPLTGAHVTVPCASCHVNNNYNLTAANTACSACHMQDFQSTTNPNHVLGGFSTTCETCHSTASWTNATFNHSLTGFPLTGAHVSVPCASCHINNNYNLTSTALYQHAIKPIIRGRRTLATLPQDFPPTARFAIRRRRGRARHSITPRPAGPLTGTHVTVACTSCHVNNNYSLTQHGLRHLSPDGLQQRHHAGESHSVGVSDDLRRVP